MIGDVREAVSLLRPSIKRRLVVSVLGSVAMALLDIAAVAALVPFMQVLTGAPRDSGALGYVTDVVGRDASDERLLAVLGVGIVLAFAVKSALTLTVRWWQLGFLASEAARSSTMLLRGYLRAPYEMHLERPTSELLRRLGDGVSQTYSNVVGGSLAIVAEVLTILGMAVVLLVTAPVPSVIAIVYVGLVSFVLTRLTGRRALRAGERRLESGLVGFRAALHSLGGVKEIAVRHNSEVFVRRYSRSQHEVVGASRHIAFLSEAPKYALELAFVVGIALLAGATFVAGGSADVATSLTLFVGAGFRVLPSVVRLISAVTLVRSGLFGYRLVRDDLPRYATDEAEEAGADARAAFGGDIVLESVGFTYPGAERPVLRDVSATIPRGTSVGIVGPSGSGKTTLVNLLLGLLTPTSGRILVGGRPLGEELRAWQLGIGLVPQLVYAFDGSLRANIVFDEGRGDDDRLLDAVHRAELDDLIAERGLDVEVGERGVGLSGGQQQRIGIARALYHRPSVLVLDEATSALDNVTEHAVTSALARAEGEVTSVVVAHRLSTVRRCDQILFLEGGRVAASGTFDEVVAASETFARMVELGSLDGPGR
ncbi:ABC transporter ATP-binding protein [Phycicoccus sp. CSK15P-2]|uniref:ABC transporter ATP-binding protein n=1 Tax=Phycicoccus sp. CSK15P-2 TaxID=2807627 RepID=UPI001951F710|nr:ABC transporter ATP-binding protein [Phycicoccus sp. CSK15P-2]MBM6404308.1 ABC transporter ATP-binding protein [Phycicoccus sp. CSK15P-2]